MKIGSNPVGNYVPLRNANKSIPKSKDFDLNTELVSKNEKEFFSTLYPADKNKIMQHHFYMKNGNMSGVMVGSLLDRRG
jgi:hypothetical protein